MGMGAQGQQLGTQVFYDAESGQYYTQSPQAKNGMGQLFGRILGIEPNQKNYLTNFNNQSIAARPTPQHNYIDIAALFPEMYQGAQGMQGDSQASAGLLGGQGAAQSASSGAGRFM
jgi:hypothetical protein